MSERTDTSRSGDLVERLRERTCVVFNSPGVHPDTECLEAADRIEALEAENARLREAVQAQMDAKHRESAEAKLWFTKAQEWKAENERLTAILSDMNDTDIVARTMANLAVAREALEKLSSGAWIICRDDPLDVRTIARAALKEIDNGDR